MTRYLNTDLDLTAAEDLTALAAALEAAGVFALHITHGDDGLWHASFETSRSYLEPEPNIANMLDVIESLQPPLLETWARCTRREFNIGYDCGERQPRVFEQGLTPELLGRISATGAGLRLTLYSLTES